MSYKELGFNQLLNKRSASYNMLEDSSSRFVTSLSGSNINGGTTSSNTGTLSINWDTGEIIINDGARQRVLLGYVAEEDAYGIKIKNANGETVFSVAGQVGSGGIEDSSITSDKLEDGSVDNSKLSENSVDTINIIDYAVTDAKITSLSADKILAGDLVVAVNVGEPATGYVRLDGGNNRIIINDGTNNRILIGYQRGGF